MSKARVQAYLDMNISGFQAGLERANSFLEVFKRNVKTGDLGNGIKGLLGAGALVTGFRMALDHARELRREAQETGRTIDKWTAAAARFSDVLFGAKETGAGLLTKGLGALNIGGEKVGDFAVWLSNKLGLSAPGEYDTKRGESAQAGAEQAEANLIRARKNIPEGFVRDYNRQMRGLERQKAMIGADVPAQIAEMQRNARDLRSQAAGLTRPEDFVERKKIEQEALRLEVDAAKQTHELSESRRKNEEKRWDFLKENTTKEETTAEKINRLRQQADREQARALDTTRSLAEREEHRMRTLEFTAQAAKLEYEWKNKPLTVAEAAANTASGRRNTTSVGTAARKIQRLEDQAERARSQGRYDAAERYGNLARMEREKFDVADRESRQAAAERAKGGAASGSWDARYGAQMAARSARLEAHYGGAYVRPESFAKARPAEESADSLLKQAAEELKGAAAAITTAFSSEDTDD